MKFLFVGALAYIKIQFMPSLDLMAILFVAMVIDFATGCWKAKVQGKARTSSGFKRTITKFVQYAGAIVGGGVLAYIGEQKGGAGTQVLFGWFNQGLIFFILYIEVTSIFENLYEIDTESMISKYFYQPAIKILTFQLKNNPVIKKAEALKEDAVK
jgi:phage-related holin